MARTSWFSGAVFLLPLGTPLLYHTLRSLSRGFLNFFSFGREILFYFTQLRIGERLFTPVCLLTPLLYHNLDDLSRGFSKVCVNFFSTNTTRSAVAYPLWTLFLLGYLVCHSLLTPIVYHTPPQKSTWQNTQIREKQLFDFCTTFLLTNWLGCGIMEIPGRVDVAGPLKKRGFPLA